MWARNRLIIIDWKPSKAVLTVFSTLLLNPSFPQSLRIDFDGCKLQADEATSPTNLRPLVVNIVPNQLKSGDTPLKAGQPPHATTVCCEIGNR
jgi:hypothetical protein